MLLSRFWYIVLSVALAAALFFLYLATAVSNRTANRTAGRLLTSASKAVGWYMQDDARNRAAALIPLTLDSAISKGLAKANNADKLADLDRAVRDDARKALTKFQETNAANGLVFDKLWAVDVHGRVLANFGDEQNTNSEYFEMGGYSLVADALHGWIRDDAWVFNGDIYRVVGRPVETSAGSYPAGALVGAKRVDDKFAQAISDNTGAAVAFYADNARIATGAPSSFNKAALEVHSADLSALLDDADYNEKGRTAARELRKNAGYDVTAIFARMPGEAWDMGAGYVVGHEQATVSDPLEFQRLATEEDKSAVPLMMIIGLAAAGALLGLLFSLFEHTMPLRRFHRAVADLGNKSSSTDVLKPSTFGGLFKKIAANVNDALDKVAAQSGVDRGPADLEKVLGPLPAQPQMSAFAVPDANAPSAEPAPVAARSVPKAKRVIPKASTPGEAAAPASSDAPKPASGAAAAAPARWRPTAPAARVVAASASGTTADWCASAPTSRRCATGCCRYWKCAPCRRWFAARATNPWQS